VGAGRIHERGGDPDSESGLLVAPQEEEVPIPNRDPRPWPCGFMNWPWCGRPTSSSGFHPGGMKDGSRGSKRSETPGPATLCLRIPEGMPEGGVSGNVVVVGPDCRQQDVYIQKVFHGNSSTGRCGSGAAGCGWGPDRLKPRNCDHAGPPPFLFPCRHLRSATATPPRPKVPRAILRPCELSLTGRPAGVKVTSSIAACPSPTKARP